MREITHEEPLGDDVFQVIGILLCIQFNVYIYISDNERVHVRRFGVDIPHIPGCESVKSYDVRFEPFGLTYEEVRACNHNPLYIPGHWEPVTGSSDGVKDIPYPPNW